MRRPSPGVGGRRRQPPRLGTAPARTAVPFGLPHRVQDVQQAQIDLPALHVDLDDLHGHLVAEPVFLAGILAAQDVCPLDEPVVVIGHRRDVHQPLDEVLDQLDEQPERGDAGDVALEFVADLVGHEADLLPLHQLALGIGGAPFPLGGMPRHFRQVFLELLPPLFGQ